MLKCSEGEIDNVVLPTHNILWPARAYFGAAISPRLQVLLVEKVFFARFWSQRKALPWGEVQWATKVMTRLQPCISYGSKGRDFCGPLYIEPRLVHDLIRAIPVPYGRIVLILKTKIPSLILSSASQAR